MFTIQFLFGSRWLDATEPAANRQTAVAMCKRLASLGDTVRYRDNSTGRTYAVLPD